MKTLTRSLLLVLFLGVMAYSAGQSVSVVNIPTVNLATDTQIRINETIKFNAVEDPRKQAAFPQYKYPNAIFRYARIADYLGLGGKTDAEKVELLVKAIDELKAKVNMPKTIHEAGVTADKFYETLDNMAEQAFDDQCTGANPRYPLISEIKQMYINAFEGTAKKADK